MTPIDLDNSLGHLRMTWKMRKYLNEQSTLLAQLEKSWAVSVARPDAILSAPTGILPDGRKT